MRNVKTKISVAVLAISGCVMMMFAAKVDPCTEKYNSCSDSCTNALAHCKAGQTDPDRCEKAQKICMQACDKAKNDCEGNAKKK